MLEKKPKKIFSWMNPKLEIRDTKKYGNGGFVKNSYKGYLLP